MNNRTFCVGDVHGCLTELLELLLVCRWNLDIDTLVFVGDLVDRGPDPRGVVGTIMTLQRNHPGRVLICRGNHDDKVVQWFDRVQREKTTGKPNQMRRPHDKVLAEWESLTADQVAWLQNLPVLVTPAPGWIAVHAGFEATPREKQRDDKLMRVRWVFPDTGKMAPMGPDFDQPEGSVYWTEMWEGPENVVYGHAVHSLSTPRVDRPRPGVECWGIDTGACFGGRLTALCLETREVFQVQAKRKYSNLVHE